MKKTLLFLATSLVAAAAGAQQFQLIPKADTTSGITMTIPYDLGTHHGVASRVSGVITASQNFTIITGKLVVPIQFMATGNPTRDCHMREALGLDYSKSHFPAAHICDSHDQLPATGVDAIAFPTVEFTLLGVTGGGDIASELKPGSTITLTANGSWNIHNVQKTVSFPLTLTVLANGTISIEGSVPFSLSDYKVVVKPVLGIGVKNDMTANLDLLMAVVK